MAALRAFAAQGYDGMSVRTLNAGLNISHNTLHQRFGSKEGLWKAAVEHGFKRLRDALFKALAEVDNTKASALSIDLQVVETGIMAFLYASARQPELLRLMNQEGAVDSPRLDHIFANFIEPVLGPLAASLERLHYAGRIRKITLRSLLFLLAHGAAAPFTLTATRTRFDEREGEFDAEQHIELMTQIIINGILLPQE